MPKTKNEETALAEIHPLSTSPQLLPVHSQPFMLAVGRCDGVIKVGGQVARTSPLRAPAREFSAPALPSSNPGKNGIASSILTAVRKRPVRPRGFDPRRPISPVGAVSAPWMACWAWIHGQGGGDCRGGGGEGGGGAPPPGGGAPGQSVSPPSSAGPSPATDRRPAGLPGRPMNFVKLPWPHGTGCFRFHGGNPGQGPDGLPHRHSTPDIRPRRHASVPMNIPCWPCAGATKEQDRLPGSDIPMG